VAMGREIEMLERQSAMDAELNNPIAKPLTNSPTGQGEPPTGRATAEYGSAFWKSMRNKAPSFEVMNALQIGQDSEGGVLVPDEFERTLIAGLSEENIIRELATIIRSSHGDRKIPVVASQGSAQWVDEGEEVKESDDKFDVATLGAHKLATIIRVSEELLADSAFDIENYIANEFARRFGSAEEHGFIIGNGTGKPTGFLSNAQIGVTAASATAITADEIIDLYHSLKTPYRRKATFVTNDATVKAIRKLKDTTGQYMWQPGLQAGTPDTILNRPIKTSAYMPTIEAGAKTIAFGDFSYYWISDRQGRSLQRLNELFAKQGQIGFRATQRVDGKLLLPEAIKLLQAKSA